MTAPGWYPDPTSAGAMRYWDGGRWTEHVAPTPAPAAPGVPPAAQPRLRPDGSVRGPSFRLAMVFLLGGLLTFAVSLVVVVPAVVDSVSGPTFDVPGGRTLELEVGTWVIYERTGRSTGSGGLRFDVNDGVSIGPGQVEIRGPESVQPRSDLRGGVETITRGAATYTGVVRFDIRTAGSYEVEVRAGDGVSGGEVLVARPVFELFSKWPWFVAAAAAGVAMVTGFVLWAVGATNRRTARRAGMAT